MVKNFSVTISRGHMLVPGFFNSEDRFKKALEESILKPLRRALGKHDIPVYPMSLARMDYLDQPFLEEETAKNALEIYERYSQIKPIDCQEMVSLATRIKNLLYAHIKLEDELSETQNNLKSEKRAHNETNDKLKNTTEELSSVGQNLEHTADMLKQTKISLEHEIKASNQAMRMV